MVWGCMVNSSVWSIFAIDETLDSGKFQTLQLNDLPPASKLSEMAVKIIQDNASYHVSNIVDGDRTLEDNNVRVLGEPAQSPDMNPAYSRPSF